MKTLFYAFFGALLLAQPAISAPSMQDGITHLQKRWAEINYTVSGKDARLAQMKALADEGDQLIAAYPGKAEPLIWTAIVKSTEAGMKGGMKALKIARRSRDELQQAIAIDGMALNGMAYTSIGSLYYQVPGGIIGFGSKKKARVNLLKGLQINPDDIDANYFYADFLMHRKKYEEAIRAFEKALAAPARPDRPLADKGRRAEIAAGIAEAKGKLTSR